MDKPRLSDTIISELTDLFAVVLNRNAEQLLEHDLDGMEQHVQEIARSIFGPLIEKAIMTIASALPSQVPYCPGCRQRMRLVDDERPRNLQGLVGDYRLVRPYFICEHCRQGCAPLDERLGIGGGVLSPGLMRVTARLGIDDSFEDAVDAVQETLRIELKDEAVRRVTEGIGQVAEEEMQAAMALVKAGKDPLGKEEVKGESAVLLVETDGVMVHEVDGDWHEMKVGLVAPLGPTTCEDVKTKRSTLAMGNANYCAGLESAETFWFRLYVEAFRRGLGSALVTTVVLLGDGAEWIWRYAPTFLAVGSVKVVEILDIYHAFEHLGTVANAMFGQGSKTGEEWLRILKQDLEEQGPAPVLAALAELKPEDEGASEEVRKAVGYFTENATRMDYPTFTARKYPIGSGAIESACKTLIEEREKGAGMRWTKQGAQSVATLRALHRSGRWAVFWKTHPQRRRPAVLARRPTKATPPTRSQKQAA